MKREFLDYIEDIIEAIDSIEKFIKDIDCEEFILDDKTASAIIRKLEIIGEAVKKIPKNIKNDYSQIPWKDIAGMRDKLIHDYFGVDLKRVWKTAKKDVPKLKILFKKILKNYQKKITI